MLFLGGKVDDVAIRPQQIFCLPLVVVLKRPIMPPKASGGHRHYLPPEVLAEITHQGYWVEELEDSASEHHEAQNREPAKKGYQDRVEHAERVAKGMAQQQDRSRYSEERNRTDVKVAHLLAHE